MQTQSAEDEHICLREINTPAWQTHPKQGPGSPGIHGTEVTLTREDSHTQKPPSEPEEKGRKTPTSGPRTRKCARVLHRRRRPVLLSEGHVDSQQQRGPQCHSSGWGHPHFLQAACPEAVAADAHPWGEGLAQVQGHTPSTPGPQGCRSMPRHTGQTAKDTHVRPSVVFVTMVAEAEMPIKGHCSAKPRWLPGGGVRLREGMGTASGMTGRTRVL